MHLSSADRRNFAKNHTLPKINIPIKKETDLFNDYARNMTETAEAVQNAVQEMVQDNSLEFAERRVANLESNCLVARNVIAEQLGKLTKTTQEQLAVNSATKEARENLFHVQSQLRAPTTCKIMQTVTEIGTTFNHYVTHEKNYQSETAHMSSLDRPRPPAFRPPNRKEDFTFSDLKNNPPPYKRPT